MFVKLLISVVLINCYVVSGQKGSYQGEPKSRCVDDGKYCQVNSDCCSLSCQSYSYKCVNSGPIAVIVNKPAQKPNNTLNTRFGEEEPICKQVGGFCQTNGDCCSGECLSFSYKCIEGNKLITQDRPSVNRISNNKHSRRPLKENDGYQGDQPQSVIESTDSLCTQKNGACSSTKSCCAFLTCDKNICRDDAVFVSGTETLGYTKPNTTDLNNRFSENENVPSRVEVITAPENQEKCLELGSKCFKNSVCCSERCHDFLHQCVT